MRNTKYIMSMKKIVTFLVMMFIVGIVFGQNTAIVKTQYPLVYEKIAKQSENKWPGDYQMQKYTIGLECDSFIEFLDLFSGRVSKYIFIPKNVISETISKAFGDWSQNPNWTECWKIEKGKNLDDVFSCCDPDWQMIVYTMKNQYDAYLELH